LEESDIVGTGDKFNNPRKHFSLVPIWKNLYLQIQPISIKKKTTSRRKGKRINGIQQQHHPDGCI